MEIAFLLFTNSRSKRQVEKPYLFNHYNRLNCGLLSLRSDINAYDVVSSVDGEPSLTTRTSTNGTKMASFHTIKHQFRTPIPVSFCVPTDWDESGPCDYIPLPASRVEQQLDSAMLPHFPVHPSLRTTASGGESSGFAGDVTNTL